MVKKIKKEISEFPYSKVWMWAKRIFWSILILAIVYGAGTFYPNQLAKKWANEELRQEHTKWAQNLGLYPPEEKGLNINVGKTIRSATTHKGVKKVTKEKDGVKIHFYEEDDGKG